MSAVDCKAATPLKTKAAEEREDGDLDFSAAIVLACRSASVKSPAASRSALAKHRAVIDPGLAEILEKVGNYSDEVCFKYHPYY